MASEIETLRSWLSGADFTAVNRFAGENKRALSYLTALTYDPNPLISWRAVESIGLVAAVIAESDPEFVRVHLRRLIWLLNDESGGIGWRAPEAVGEIIRQRSDLFGEFIPILVNLMDMEPRDALQFRTGWLWALGRLAEAGIPGCQDALPWILPCLDDPFSQVRGLAVWCLGKMKYPFPPDLQRSLGSDTGEVVLYISPNEVQIRIGELFQTLFSEY